MMGLLSDVHWIARIRNSVANTVHGSRASPQTVLLDRRFKYLPVRPELVEGLRSNYESPSKNGIANLNFTR
jgi:hypothetical protein